MHHLRKAVPAHRGLRPGVLVVALACLAACTGKTPASTKPAGAGLPPGAVASWYQLEAGALQPIPGPAATAAVPLKAWTVQARIADMTFLGDTLFLALNGTGLASVTLDATRAPTFAYYADALIFPHRTVTTMIPRQGTIAVHLYFNVLLNDVRPQDLPLAGISLVTFLPGQSQYTFLIPPFQKKNTEWEAAGFAPESENSFDFEWKFTDAAETRFAYTRFHADTKAEETVTREDFQAALGVPAITGSSVPGDLAAYFAACRAQIPSLGADTSLQFSLRSRESPVRRNYRSRPQSDSAVLVPVFEEAGERTALLPTGVLLSATAAGSRTVQLPSLPAGMRYTDIVKTTGNYVLSWENTSFTDVGAAGLLFYRVP